mgnify:CR=1 FL=1
MEHLTSAPTSLHSLTINNTTNTMDPNIALALPNLRDVGGLSITPTTSIRHGILFRAAAPSSAPSDAPALATAFAANHIKYTYDLRSNVEIKRHDGDEDNSQAILPSGVKRISAPVFRNDDYSPEANALRYKDYADEDSTRGFTAAYRAILGSGQEAYSKILRHLADESGKPDGMLVHCTAGKDRTGVIVAVVLAICGVKDEAIAQEYGLSEEGLKDWRQKAIAHLSQNPALANNPDGILRMLGSK